jgi:hypothetical protein
VSTKKVGKKRTPQVEREATQLLESPGHFHSVSGAVRRGGLVGEERNALVLYLVGLSSLLQRPLNAIVKGSSSAGKNFLVSRVLRLFPPDTVREITSSSKTAWNYGGDDFRNKIVYLQERNDAAGAVHPVRLLISEGKLIRTVTVGRVAKTFVAEGPIASISTTTRDRIEVDDESRHISLWLDESRNQTRRVNVSYLSPEPPLSDHELAVWRQAYSLIKERAEIPMVIPEWFKIVANKAYDSEVIARRYFPAFVEACKTISLVRSFEKYGSDSPPRKITVSFADFAIATILFEDTFAESLHGKTAGDPSARTRKAVEELSETTEGTAVGAKDLAEHLSISEDRAYGLLRDAVDAGVIERSNKPEKGNAKRYRPAPLPRFAPDPGEVLAQAPEITTTVAFVHPLTGKSMKLRRRKD